MDQDAPKPPKNPDAIIPLGSTASEVDAHLLADALRTAGLDARAMDAHAGGALPFSSLFPASILVRAGDYAQARAIVESFEPAGRQIRVPSKCPVCRYSTEGLADDAACPECGTDLGHLRTLHRTFKFGPPPGTGKGVQRLGALIAIVMLVLMVALVIGAAAQGFFGSP